MLSTGSTKGSTIVEGYSIVLLTIEDDRMAIVNATEIITTVTMVSITRNIIVSTMGIMKTIIMTVAKKINTVTGHRTINALRRRQDVQNVDGKTRYPATFVPRAEQKLKPKPIHCANCGAAVPANASFCSACGQKL